jgi:hypothetical protein
MPAVLVHRFLYASIDRLFNLGFVQAAKEEEERKKRERLAKEALAKIREVSFLRGPLAFCVDSILS